MFLQILADGLNSMLAFRVVSVLGRRYMETGLFEARVTITVFKMTKMMAQQVRVKWDTDVCRVNSCNY